ncbi:MAG: putative S-layer protein [Nanobdellota archaeon]
MRIKGIFNVLMVLMLALMATAAVSAVPVTVDEVEVNDEEVSPSGENSIRVVDRDDQMEVDVKLTATASVEDVQVEAVLRGFDDNKLIEDITDVFDMKANRTYIKKLDLELPGDLDKDQYRLRVRIDDRDGDTTQETYELEIENERHDVKIKDIMFSPYGQVTAGRALLTSLRLENFGMVDEDDGVKVTVRIPELGLAASDYIDEIEEDESLSSEELYVRIPKCTKEGTYDVEVLVEFDDGEETVKATKEMKIVESEVCVTDDEKETKAKPKTIIGVGPKSQDVNMGEGAVYPVTITNAGNSAKTYVVEADGYTDWADVRVSPANIVVLQPGEAKALYVYASPMQDAKAGEHMFSLSISSSGEKLKEFTLKSNVKESEQKADSNMSVKNVLLIGLLVLVVLLVILGLIIGFGKLKSDDKEFGDEDTESGETYY